jgi:hypothetical protein
LVGIGAHGIVVTVAVRDLGLDIVHVILNVV